MMESNSALFVLFLAFEGLSVWGSLEDLSGKLANAIWKDFRDSLGDGMFKLDEVLSKYENTKKRLDAVRHYESLTAWARCAVPISVSILFILCLLGKAWPSTCGILCITWATISIVVQVGFLLWLANKKANLKKWDPENSFKVELPKVTSGEKGLERL